MTPRSRRRVKNMNEIMTNPIALDVMCLDIVETARDYYKANLPGRGDDTLRELVEFWVENFLTPALECAIDDVF